ncbi:MAG: HAD family hydrolase [Candidatus Nitrospinota bacterium M3_3B_026]
MRRFDVDLLVFDLDGTLIDSRQDIADSLNQTFRRVGYDPLPMETIAGFVGNGVGPLIRRSVEAAGHADKLEQVMEIFRGIYWERLLDTTRLFGGVEETLKKLEGGYRMGIVSNKPERYTKRIVAELGLARYVGGAVYGGDTLPVKKPDPAAVLRIAAGYSVLVSKTLIVGDSAVDIETGKNAGAFTVGAVYGFRSREELLGAGPDAVIESFGELAGLLGAG